MDIQRVGLANKCEGLTYYDVETKLESQLPDTSKKSVLLIIPDFTRPFSIVESILYRLLKQRSISVDMVVANGMHRPSTIGEIRRKVGAAVDDCIIYQNHPFQDEDWLPKVAYGKCVIALSNPLPHNHVGMSGGGKLILPGLSHWSDVNAFHANTTLTSSRLLVDAGKRIINCHVGVSYGEDAVVNDVCVADSDYDFYNWVDRTKDFYKVDIKSPLPDVVILEPCVKKVDFMQSMNAMLIAKHGIVRSGGTIFIMSDTIDGMGTHYLFQQPNGKTPAYYDTVFKDELSTADIHFCMPNVSEQAIRLYFDKCKPMNLPDFGSVVRYLEARHGTNARVIHYTAPDISIGERV